MKTSEQTTAPQSSNGQTSAPLHPRLVFGKAIHDGTLEFANNVALSYIAEGKIAGVIKNSLSITANESLKDTLDTHNIAYTKIGNTLYVSSKSFTEAVSDFTLMGLAQAAYSTRDTGLSIG